MTGPAPSNGPFDPIVLDSSVLVAYERMKSPGAAPLNEAQSVVGRWLERQVPLLVPALSLAVASHECGGRLPEVDFLLSGDPDLVIVVPLARESAVDVGAEASNMRGEALEVAHVAWCATGFDDAGPEERWSVATYWPDWYADSGVPIIAL